MKTAFLKKALSLILSASVMLSILSTCLSAELMAAAADESYVPISEIKAATASSFQSGYDPWKAFDGISTDANNCWHTPWGADMVGFPHWIMAEFTKPQMLDALIYCPRSATEYQFVTDYEVWASPDSNEDNLKKIAQGSWSRGEQGVCTFSAQEVTLVKFVILAKTDANSNPEDTSVSAAEIKFRRSNDQPGAYDSQILNTLARVEHVLSYAKAHIGSDAYSFTSEQVEQLSKQSEALKPLLNTGNAETILAQLQAVETEMLNLLSSNKPAYEALVTDIPVSIMSAGANSYNSGYEPGKAIDGNINTIWHSEWTPENDPFPHILTIDLGRAMLLDEISISPRQDMTTGKITKGQIFAGDDPEHMTFVTDFVGSSGADATVVDLQFTTARYVQIYSLAATSPNTAISEVKLTTYDRGIASAFQQYDYAVDLLRKAAVGDAIGEYAAADVEAFRQQVDTFDKMVHQENLSIAQYYDIRTQITNACADFLLKENAYTKADLSRLIEQLDKLTENMNETDRQNAADIKAAAQQLVLDAVAKREEIQQMANQLTAFYEAVDSVSDGVYNLSGAWQVALEAYSPQTAFGEYVTLPGTLDTNKVGTYNSYDEISRLSRYYTYTGPATYQKELYISEAWADKAVLLYMERTRESCVFVNGTQVTAGETAGVLPVAQQYDLSKYLHFGAYNTISIVVDNSYPNLPTGSVSGSHIATDETQTNWNGIVGRFELLVHEKVFIDDLRVYPNDDLKSVTVQVDLQNQAADSYSGMLNLRASDDAERTIPVSLSAGECKTLCVSDFALNEKVLLWSEFDQPLYEMMASLDNGESVSEAFGMRVFEKSADGTKFTINQTAVFLRSEANCAVFPLTGYAPMDEDGWEKLFTTYQSYGINAVRFHSWCPPDAAFRVADRMGLYLQPELSCWDSAMFSDNVRRSYYSKEAFAILKEYANHPSFVMFSFGNELQYAGDAYQYADTLIGKLKEYDSTRMYAPGSNVSFSSANPTANTDYYTAQAFWGTPLRGAYGGMGGFINQDYPSSKVNYDDAVKRISAFGVPCFSFEVGQFQVFPDVLTEIEKYTGVLDARNFKLIAEKIQEKGISEEEIKATINASGMLSRLAYKAEIEAALRTKDLSGISLLGIQDFSGQGTALVGMMNAFGESKPYDFADADAFSKFFAPTVVLLETDKFCYTNAEKLTGNLLFSNYSQSDLSGEVAYTLKDADGNVLANGKTASKRLAQGTLTNVGELSVSLDEINEPAQLCLELSCLDAVNSYHIWVYPEKQEVSQGEVYIAEYLDDIALEILSEGGKVFLSPKADKSVLPESVAGSFTTAFWSSMFTSESQPGTLGLLLDPSHPLFDTFPTEYYADYQWWAMSKLGRPMNLEGLTNAAGEKIQPLIKVPDGFTNLNNLGLLYEARVGGGKLVVSSMGLEQLKHEYPEAAALRNAILRYMNSQDFDPQFEVDVETVKAQVLKAPGDERENLASKYNGGKPATMGQTETCQGGYDREPMDRLCEINDGVVDITVPSRAWTDFRGDKTYAYDVELGIELDKSYLVDTVAFAFFEDSGCKAPAGITVFYWNGSEYVLTTGQSTTTGYQAGINTISFDAVQTNRLKFVMVHEDGMAVAISEMFVYETIVNPQRITVVSQDGKNEITLRETLQMSIETDPSYANNTLVRWSVLDESGAKSKLASIGFDGVLTPKAVGTVTVRAELRSDPSIYSQMVIRITKARPGDMDFDEEINVADIIRLKTLIMAGEWSPDELAAGDLNQSGSLDVADILAIKNMIMAG